MRIFLLTAIIALTTSSMAHAQLKAREGNTASDDTPTIFDVRKSLPMEPTDPSYHDFYINAGIEAGFKRGQYLPVQRAIPIHDPVQNKQQGILTVPVGKILVIHVERNITVARLASELGDDERPTLEYEAIMIGDRIDMKGITTEAPKDSSKKKKRGTAAVELAPVGVAIIIPAGAPTSAPVLIAAPATSQISAAPAAAPIVAEAPAPPKAEVSAPQPASEKSDTVKSDSKTPTSPSVSPQRVTQPVPPPTA